jgi:hypothetical protein
MWALLLPFEHYNMGGVGVILLSDSRVKMDLTKRPGQHSVMMYMPNSAFKET